MVQLRCTGQSLKFQCLHDSQNLKALIFRFKKYISDVLLLKSFLPASERSDSLCCEGCIYVIQSVLTAGTDNREVCCILCRSHPELIPCLSKQSECIMRGQLQNHRDRNNHLLRSLIFIILQYFVYRPPVNVECKLQ